MIATIPCDLSVQAYCNLPGKAYPWHAVRRFVHENQGLMRRMYGDVRHISVLRTEIDNNDIEIDDIESAAERYSGKRDRQGRVYNQNNLKQRSNDVITEPHFRPTTTQRTTTATVESTTESTTTTTTPHSSSTTPITSSSTASTTTTQSSLDDSDLEDDNNTLNNNILDIALQELIEANIESNSVFGNITENKNSSIKKQLQAYDNIEIVDPPNLMNDSMKSETATISTTLKLFNVEKTPETTTKKSEIVEVIKETPAQDKIDKITDDDEDDDDSDVVEVDEDDSEEEIDSTVNTIVDDNVSTASQANPVKVSPSSKNKVGMEGQLYQDVVQKDSPAIVNMRGV